MRRRPLILTAIGLAALVIAYAVYWFMLSRIVAQDIAGWTGFYRSQGYAVSYEVPPLSGFPFAVTARFIHPDVAAPDGRPMSCNSRAWAARNYPSPGHKRARSRSRPICSASMCI